MPSERLIRPLLLLGAVGVLLIAGLIVPLSLRFAEAGLWCIPFLVAFAAGAIAVRASPDNLAARRLLAFGTTTVVWLGASYALMLAVPDSGAVGDWFAPLNLVVQVLGMGLVVAMVALLAVYPDGVAQRAYEPVVVRITVAAGLLAPLLLFVCGERIVPAWVIEWNLESEPDARVPDVASPLHVEGLEWLAEPPRFVLDAALGLLPLVGVLLLAARYFRFPKQRRLQIKWPFYAALLLALTAATEPLAHAGVLPLIVSDLIEVVALILLPASLAIGIVRPEMFDLETAVRRSAVFVMLWIVIVAAWAGLATALGIAAGGENLQVAVAIAVVATLLLEPARRALSRRAARYAYGQPVSGEELVQQLGATLEHTLDVDELVAAIAATAREGLGVRWVRISVDGGPIATDGDVGSGPASRIEPLAQLGTIEVGPPTRRAAPPELLSTLARQATLALTNARLAAELGDRLDELAASRARIVQAEERARRRIERDIHDGAQQELAALIARIGLARNQLRRGDAAKLTDTLGDLQSEAAQALEHLRELASGIHPSVLSDTGIVQAIEGRAARLPIGVTLEIEPGLREKRFPGAVEGAVWFLVCESFANTLKHAAATRVTVRIAHAGGELQVEVSDDGAGFDRAAVNGSGSGLAGLEDRFAALGGRLDVSAAPGAGASLRATLPAVESARV